MINFKKAHDHSYGNKAEILASEVCGCFYCCRTFSPKKIKEFVRDRPNETALCPYCGIDSVLGDASGLPVTNLSFLDEMETRWFGLDIE